MSILDSQPFADYGQSSMRVYKRNQVEEAIFATLGARDTRVEELKFRAKRLLVTDRRFGRDTKSDEEEDRHYAFYSGGPSGSGVEVMFSSYESFALLAAIILLEHGWPQASVIRVIRQVRRTFEVAYAQTLKRDPKVLFDQEAIMAQAKPGLIAVDNTHPVFLAIVRLTESVGNKTGAAAIVCQGHDALMSFIRKRSIAGLGVTFFEFARLMHTFAEKLSETRPVNRGRGAS